MEQEKKKHVSGMPIVPTEFAIGGQIFKREELVGFAAKTVRKRLAERGVDVSNKWAQAFVERHNKKGE